MIFRVFSYLNDSKGHYTLSLFGTDMITNRQVFISMVWHEQKTDSFECASTQSLVSRMSPGCFITISPEGALTQATDPHRGPLPTLLYKAVRWKLSCSGSKPAEAFF